MTEAKCIRILVFILGFINIPLLLQVLNKRETLLNKLYDADLYVKETEVNSVRKIRDIESKDRPRKIINGYYVDANNQMKFFINGLFFTVILFFLPLSCHLLKNIGINSKSTFMIIRWIIILLSIFWIIACSLKYKKVTENNRELILLTKK